MENALRANPQDLRDQYEKQLKEPQEAYGEAMLELRVRKNWSLCWARTRSDRDDPPGTQRRRSRRASQQVMSVDRRAAPNGVLPPDKENADRARAVARPIKRLIEEHPAFGYRTVAHL